MHLKYFPINIGVGAGAIEIFDQPSRNKMQIITIYKLFAVSCMKWFMNIFDVSTKQITMLMLSIHSLSKQLIS